MTGYEMFWPMIAHAALVFILYGLLSLRRVSVVRQGKAKASDFRENLDEPVESRLVNNCIANQFELPVLFYVCCTLLYLTEADNLPTVVLAWLFVALRYAHAFVHVTSNRLSIRRPIFVAGFVVLLAMWVWLGAWIAFS